MSLDSKMRCPRQSALDARNDWLNDEKRVELLRETGKRSERQQEKLTGDAKKMKNSTQKIVQRTHGRDTHDTTGDHIAITMGGPQLSLLDRAYTALKESVYDALLPQTRLKPYLDDISLALDAGGNFSLDFAALDAANDGMWRQQA